MKPSNVTQGGRQPRAGSNGAGVRRAGGRPRRRLPGTAEWPSAKPRFHYGLIMTIRLRRTRYARVTAVLSFVICILISGCRSSSEHPANSADAPELSKLLSYQV